MATETRQCEHCGEEYNYDDEASPQWAALFCSKGCADTYPERPREDE